MLTQLTSLDALELHRCQPQGDGSLLMGFIASLTGMSSAPDSKMWLATSVTSIPYTNQFYVKP